MTTSNFFNDYSYNENTNMDLLTDTVETENYVLDVDSFLQFEMIAAMMEVTVDYLLDEFFVDGQLNLEDVPWEEK